MQKIQDYGVFINSWLKIYMLKKNFCLSNNNKADIHPLNVIRNFIFENKINEVQNEDKHINENGDFIVDKIQIKNEIEIHEKKYPVESEFVSCGFQIKNDVLCRNSDFKVEELKQTTETFDFEPKMKLEDYILKEEEILINDVTQSICCDNEIIKQKELKEYSFSSSYEETINTNKIGTISSG